MRICDAAFEVLVETDNPAVMWGDCGLLDLIAFRAGMSVDVHPQRRHRRVMGALSRQPGELIRGTTLAGNGRRVRIFWLPGNEPAYAR